MNIYKVKPFIFLAVGVTSVILTVIMLINYKEFPLYAIILSSAVSVAGVFLNFSKGYNPNKILNRIAAKYSKPDLYFIFAYFGLNYRKPDPDNKADVIMCHTIASLLMMLHHNLKLYLWARYIKNDHIELKPYNGIRFVEDILELDTDSEKADELRSQMKLTRSDFVILLYSAKCINELCTTINNATKQGLHITKDIDITEYIPMEILNATVGSEVEIQRMVEASDSFHETSTLIIDYISRINLVKDFYTYMITESQEKTILKDLEPSGIIN